MNIVIGLIAFLFMLSVIVIIHELGHFLVARHFGVYCHEFSIGMGPALYQHQGKETLFSIRAIPFGGYVMMAGEEDGSQDESTAWLQDVPADRRLNNIKRWQQICVMLAGIVMNILLAWVIFVGLALSRGYETLPPKPIVEEVIENSCAQEAGLQKGDTILKVETEDGTVLKPETQMDFLEFVQYNHGPLTLTIDRDGKKQTVSMTPDYDDEMHGYTTGYVVIAYYQYVPWYKSLWIGTQDMFDTTTSIFTSLSYLIRGVGVENLSGPIGILNVTAQTTALGLESYLNLFAMISLNIGIFNAIPIPALDGGRVLILLIEKVIRRKINTKFVENVIMASFVLLMALFVFATYNDITRIL